jgi:hypothetical protein
MILANDDPIAVDRLLSPCAERADHWLLRRAATEVLHDEGLRFIGFGSTILSEPVPGQPIAPATGVKLVEGTIRDVLGVGRADSLQLSLGAVATRSRAGMILTRIVIAPDLTTASAESTLYCYNGSNWDRAVWRSQSLEVGTVPPIVVTMFAADPQVQAVMNLIDSIGAGFVSPEMKERGFGRGNDRWRGCGPGAHSSYSIADGSRLRRRGQGIGRSTTDHASIGRGQAITSALIN